MNTQPEKMVETPFLAEEDRAVPPYIVAQSMQSWRAGAIRTRRSCRRGIPVRLGGQIRTHGNVRIWPANNQGLAWWADPYRWKRTDLATQQPRSCLWDRWATWTCTSQIAGSRQTVARGRRSLSLSLNGSPYLRSVKRRLYGEKHVEARVDWIIRASARDIPPK